MPEVETHADKKAPGAGDRGRFVWPPRSAEGPPTVVVTPRARAALTAFEQFERVWLGMRGRSFARQAALDGWAPDERAAYCGRCGQSVGPFEADGEGCAACRRERLPWSRFVRAGSYEGTVREAILALKLEGWRRTGADLGRVVGRAIRAELDRHGVDPARAAIVPVPMSFRGRMSSGVDHTLVLARAASGASGVRVRRALRRVHGPGQAGLAASERAANVRGRILPRRGAGFEEGSVTIVLDDIRTTGATMREACKAVWKIRGGASPGPDRELVWAAVAAVTPSRDRREGVSVRSGSGASDNRVERLEK